MGVDIKVMNVQTRPYDDLYHAYITYFEIDLDVPQARVLFVDMLDTSTAYSFAIMDDKVETKSGSIFKTIASVHTHEDYFLYGGQTNYLSSPNVKYLGLDWTDTNKKYGYFEVYTDSDHCQSYVNADKIDYGIEYISVFQGTIDEDQEFRIFTDVGSIQEPPTDITLGDRDDEDYLKNLFD